MSAPIKRYKLQSAYRDCAMPDDTLVVLHADHLASHQYDEAVERALFEYALSGYSLDRGRAGQYLNEFYQCEWLGWVKCAKSRAKAAGCAE